MQIRVLIAANLLWMYKGGTRNEENGQADIADRCSCICRAASAVPDGCSAETLIRRCLDKTERVSAPWWIYRRRHPRRSLLDGLLESSNVAAKRVSASFDHAFRPASDHWWTELDRLRSVR